MAIFSWPVLKKCTQLACCAGAMVFLAAAPVLAQNAGVEQLKKELLSDTGFLKQLSQKVVRDYLIENPEILLEAQNVLETRMEAQARADQVKAIKEESAKIFHAPDDAVFGNPRGDVTIVEFYDYNCGYCKKSFPTMQALIKKDPNLRFVMKDFPILGQDSVDAHRVARAFQVVMPDKYRQFHEAMMLRPGRANAASAIDVALSLGADKDKMNRALADESLLQPFVTNGEVAYKLRINATPAYIIGHQVVSGAVGTDALVKIIEQERKRGQ
ncbi:MAG: Membrane protein [Candidatus Tokpelaia hoelldobleri]|uniref:Membrane protein n=1 Tax=Candidatus Tokpelaia hoelldobleri TaxID=1902579 RepID=A0A1U9JVA7_9HYPH|nr:MAG: Membrane protein [Candidatus Tokpelaia hoelldoblerii]